MNRIWIAAGVECKKFFHSKVPIITMLAVLLIPFIGGLFMLILKDPVLAKNMGIVTAKAQITGVADWDSYFSLLAQAISIGGVLVFGFVTSWVFGREYSDRTIKDLLALPVSRNIIVLSKFSLILLWCILLSVLVFSLGIIVGNIVGLPGWSVKVIHQGFSIFFICAVLTIMLSTPVALFASIGRGYLSPLGFLIFMLVAAQIIAATGYGHLFPWAVPALASGAAGSENAAIESISVILVLATSLIGLFCTSFWWVYADQS